MNMVALKRVKYPHGSAGREYAPGEPLVALSERDAKALYVSGRARYGEAANKTDLPNMAPVDPQRSSVDDTHAPVKEESVPLEQTYQTRHLAAGGPTGEAKPSPSSRRGRARSARTSEASEDDSD